MLRFIFTIFIINCLFTDISFAQSTIVSHEAEYELSLAEPPKTGLGLTAAGGVMKYKTEYTCDGWISSNSFILKLYYDGLGEETRLWNISTFESKDGLTMNFATQVSSEEKDGEVEKVVGEASIPSLGKEGRAYFSYPEKISVFLPSGTMFPTKFNIALLSAAQRSKKTFSGIMFDGSGFDAVSEVNVFISPTQATDLRKSIQGDVGLLRREVAYDFSMAFFPYSLEGESTGIPSYEVHSTYFSNGIAGEIIQDLGSFKIKAVLKKLRKLPEPKC